MARKTLSQNIDAGILSIGNLATMTGLSYVYLRNLISLAIASPSSYFPVLTTPNSTECRIPAGPFHAYCMKHRFPVTPTLAQAAANYNAIYPPSPEPAPSTPSQPGPSPSSPPPPSYLAAPVHPDPYAPIYATATGEPASFTATSPLPSDEMTPYQASPQTPYPLAVHVPPPPSPPPNPFE